MEIGYAEFLLGTLRSEEPESVGRKMASVAVMLDRSKAQRMLLIRRTEHAGDPWSGQIAFPGGKMQSGDGTLMGTAIREANEEVGIDLKAKGSFVGYSRPLTTHNGAMDVVPSVFTLNGRVTVTLNSEATSFRWIELDKIVDPANRVTYPMEFKGERKDVPAIRVANYLIWGLTYRMISSLFALRSSIDSPDTAIG